MSGGRPKRASRGPPVGSVSEAQGAAIDILDLGVPASRVVGWGDVAGGCLALVAALVGLVSGHPRVGLVVGAVLGVGPPLVVRRGPLLLGRLRRTRALGDSVGLVGRLVLRLRLEPSLERAVASASRTGEGRLAASLDDHARRARGRPGSGLDGFVAEWRAVDPALERAGSLLTSAVEAPEPDREDLLGRAFDAALDGTRDRLAAFASDVRGPATAIYAFGVLLPLALVGVLPAAAAAGASIPLAALVVLYDVLLPAGLVAAGCWLVARRPVAFPPPSVGADHPAVPDSPWPALGVGFAGGLVGWVVAGSLVAWSGPIAALGFGVGVPLWMYHRPIRVAGDRAAEVEEGLPDALGVVGRRVAGGSAVETAIDEAAAVVPGATGEVLMEASRVGRMLDVDIQEAFTGEHGSVSAVAGQRTREAVALLGAAAREGRPAGDVLVATGEHLDDLRRLEATARRDLSAITDTLANTAVVFGPLVGGVTVAMTARLSAAATESGGATAGDVGSFAGSAAAYPVGDLGLAVGWYVLVMAAVLAALATVLDRGADPALLGVRVGLALPTAAATYVVAVVAGGLLV